ncbi:MAG: hypothetical protein FJ088_01255 [Deltaproteobacteria bacterium]|nr:hypothetical protein [Deltaproteobacteria bacterium]
MKDRILISGLFFCLIALFSCVKKRGECFPFKCADIETEETLIREKCRGKSGNPLVVKKSAVARASGVSFSFAGIRESGAKKSCALSFWETGKAAAPGKDADGVNSLEVSEGDLLTANGNDFRVAVIFKGYETASTRVRSFICLEKTGK